jgi:tRNA dimethylallyltransferase
MKGCVWLIAGPTASGKSALAARLASAIGGEVINADSMQLYADLRVLTARPSAADSALVRHHLYGVADAAEAWSVGRWLRAAQAVLADLSSRGRPAVIVGGTGLYFRALTQGLAAVPELSSNARAAAEGLWRDGGEGAVRRALTEAGDEVAAARIERGDRQRLVRALTVLTATGQPLSAWQAGTTPTLAPSTWRGVLIAPDRAALYARCDARLGAMLDGGALDEVRALIERRLAPDLPAMKALGVREFARHLAGEIPLDEALAETRQATRHYAKRQLTWFRNQTPDWPRVTALDLEMAWEEFEASMDFGVGGKSPI